MDCLITKLHDNDSFMTKLKNSDPSLTSFFQYDAMKKTSFDVKMNKPNNGREQQLAQIIQDYMSDLTLSEQQQKNIENLAAGAKVVIGGQQAGLFGGPLYTFHKIFSLITLSNELRERYDCSVVPVFWIAGEDHDFDEVNHTFAYDQQLASVEKIKYHTLTPPESNVSRYVPDKVQMKNALQAYFKELAETTHTAELYHMCLQIIERYDTWSNMFKALVHEVFKVYGVLFIDAQYEPLRKLERPILKDMLRKHNDINKAFHQKQRETENNKLSKMIVTDTNVHLFLHQDNMRQLLTEENGIYKLSKSEVTYREDELLDLIEQNPAQFSNNVVTRPVMEEWLFNTVAFIGGPSEIKYWAELSEVFNTLDVEMPIVLPRIKITYLYTRIEKLLQQYQLDIAEVLTNGIEEKRQKFIREQASQTFLDQVSQLKEIHEEMYQKLKREVQHNQNNSNLVDKNHEIHHKQLNYLEQRYLLNIERENVISMKHFKEISESLHPMGGLQERIWNPLQIMNDFGMDVFNPSTYPPLSYTFDHIFVKP
ncbi:MAG: bacillithiol biosynthesis cysteine-adding enzyme BshC [Staphylococcus lugdunensis]|nr:bacillithiol biosynthesis cysteine-adding enzyme BshC [Staphylococcus lugdunensis]